MPTAPRRTRTPLTALLLVGAVLALLFGGAGPASAHAILTRSAPADTSVLKTAPQHITLAFTENVSLSDGSLRVLSPKNERVDRGAITHAGGKGSTARVLLRGKLAEGTYIVSWRVVSADSHPVSGAFTFSIGTPSAATAAVPDESPDDTAASRLYGFFRYVAYGGLALLIGVAVFALACWPAAAGLRPLRKLLIGGWTTLAASTAVLLLLRGPYETGQGLGAVADPSLLGRTITGRTGAALGARLLLLAGAGALAALFTARHRRTAEQTRQESAADAADRTDTSSTSLMGATTPPVGDPQFGTGARAAGVLFALGLALTWAAAEHASTGIQVPLAIPVSMLHLLAMAVWLGGLVALTLALFRAPAGMVIPAAAVARFSRLAFTAVAVLVVTGVYQSWRQLGSLDALTTTEYGNLLRLKVAAVFLVLTVAAFSRRWTAQLSHEPQTTETHSEAEPQRVRVSERVGVGASSGSGTTGGGDKAGLPGPGDPTDSPDPSDCNLSDPDPSGSSPSASDSSGPPSPSDRYRRGLRRSVAAEAVLGVVVLAITTVLTGTQPSRAAEASAAAATASRRPPAAVATVPFDVGTPNGQGKVQITFDPGQVGDNTVQALVFGPDTGVSTVPELRLTLTHRAQRIGPLDARLVDRKGYWWTESLRLPLPGTWTMRLTVRTTDIDQVTVSKDITIRPLPDY
ncbi:copper resistance CopC/CopD family protein [Streptomyces ureilyticus]|uniref:Copper resistance protein CopC/CopD n=1 Tax=Streptomyces ureilyticus TaxID=1775131 RepID=A0ABX0DPK6_9ACTN|nr:copper resistance protein CopC [Streptomyces ureilyticus]NGO43812.1 copper resistance protein CopC/CopD [Streptomyces ureilyticus]